MKKNNLWKYIQIGTDLRFLQDTDENHAVFGEAGIVGNIERILKEMDDLGLTVTITASYKLEEFQEKLLSEKVKEGRQLSSEECKELRDILSYIRHTMTAEARGKFAFVTTDKRYDVIKLLDDMAEVFAPKIYESLPDMAKFDFSEAGKCIVFERPTAAAFHILRGTEVLVRIYYKKFLRRKSEGKTWGQLLGELKNKNTGKKPNPITLNHLVNIKDSFRNPTQHPDKTYDIQEVQDLLSVCLDIVNRMISEMK